MSECRIYFSGVNMLRVYVCVHTPVYVKSFSRNNTRYLCLIYFTMLKCLYMTLV